MALDIRILHTYIYVILSDICFRTKFVVYKNVLTAVSAE